MAIHNYNLIRMGINRKRKGIRGAKVVVALSKTLISIQEIKENVDTNFTSDARMTLYLWRI